MRKVLVLTHQGDPHAEAVCSRFDEERIPWFSIITENLPSRYFLTVRSPQGEVVIKDNLGKELVLDSSWNIWFRRISNPSIEDTMHPTIHPTMHPDLVQLVNDETWKTWEGIMMSHTGKVVSDPAAINAASNKLHQLDLVRKSGYSSIYIPETLVTNDIIEVKKFYEQHDGNICFKLHKGANVNMNGDNYIVYTNKITPEHLTNFDSLRLNPSLFQEYIEKDYELRVTVIGEEVIGIAIHSQSSEISKVDFRRYDFKNVKYEHVKLPDEVENLCRYMLKHYDLKFGAFDFIYNKEGRYVFLELNPNGQWLWLEQLSGYNISKVLASYLGKE